MQYKLLNRLMLDLGIESGIAFALPLFIGQVTGNLNLSILPSLSAFFVSLFLGSIACSYRNKFLAMAIATLGSAAIVWLGTLSSHSAWLIVLLTFLVVSVATLVSIYGSLATASGQTIAILWLISTHLPGSLEVAYERFWLILLGGIWAMLLSLTGWFLYPYRPVQQALIASYRSLTRFLVTVTQAEMSGEEALWDIATSQAQYQAGMAIDQARTLWKQVNQTQLVSEPQSERLLLLIENITDLYQEVIALTEVIVTLGEMPHLAVIRPDLHEALDSLTLAMKTLDDLLELRDLDNRQELAKETRAALNTVQLQMLDLKKKFREWINSEHEIVIHLPQLLVCLRNLVRQINSTLDLFLNPQRQVQVSLESVPFSPLSYPFWKTLQSNLTFDSIIFCHALRLATVTTVAMLLAVSLHWVRGYWMAITVLFVLQPDYGGTMRRLVQRLSGTIVGGILAAGLVLNPQDVKIVLPFLVGVAALTAVSRSVNYAIFVLLLTVMIVGTLNLTGAQDLLLPQKRVFHTLIGGFLALISYYLWPIWQRRSLPHLVAILLQASLTYFQTVGSAYQGRAQSAKTLDLSLRQAELAAANALAAVRRMREEPKRFQADLEATMALLANVNSFIAGVTSLRQHLNQFQPTHTLPGLDLFIEQVTNVLQNLHQLQQTGGNASPLPDFEQSLNTVEYYSETLKARQAKELQAVSFIVAKLHYLADKVRAISVNNILNI